MLTLTSARVAGIGVGGALGALGVLPPPPQAPRTMTLAIASTAAPVRMRPPGRGRRVGGGAPDSGGQGDSRGPAPGGPACALASSAVRRTSANGLSRDRSDHD